MQLELLLPDVIGQRQHAASRRGRTANAVDQNIEAAQPVEGCLDDVIRSRAGADIRLNELFGIAACGDGSCSGEHRPAAAYQAIHNSFANSPRAAGDEDSFAGEFVCVVWDLGYAHRLTSWFSFLL